MTNPENYKSLYPTDVLFTEEILFFLLSLNIMPHLDNFHRKDVSASFATTQGQFLTIFMHEIPDLEKDAKEWIGKNLIILSARTILVGCYEKLKNKKSLNDSPIFEFFRHIRNAAAHDGRFDIRQGSVEKSAQWRDKTISYSLNGQELFGEFFAIGDTILFLQDVEKYTKGLNPQWIYEEEPPVLRRHPSGTLWPKDPRHWSYKLESTLLRLKRFLGNKK